MRKRKVRSKPNPMNIVHGIVGILGVILLSSCRSLSLPEPGAEPAQDSEQRSAVEHGIGDRLCASTRNYQVYSESYGMGNAMTLIYFEAPESELIELLNARRDLPNADELGNNPVARYNIEELIQRNGPDIPWWHPETLTDRRYASKEIPFDTLGISGLQRDVCIGRLDGHWFGFYMIYFQNM